MSLSRHSDFDGNNSVISSSPAFTFQGIHTTDSTPQELLKSLYRNRHCFHKALVL